MSLEAFAAGRRLSRARMVLYLPRRAVARSIQTMSQSGPASTTAKHRARAFLVSLCALAGARPFTLVVLIPPRPRAAEDAARAELERVAAERGLPISLLPLAVVGTDGNLLAPPAILESAQRYGGDQVLIGRGDPNAPDTDLQWTLYTRSASEGWNGPLAAGIDHTVDLLSPQQGGSLAQAEATTRVRIEGVAGLADYAAVQRLLESVPGVRRANIAAAEANSAAFDVTVRGGAAGLEEALAGSTRLTRVSADGAPPA